MAQKHLNYLAHGPLKQNLDLLNVEIPSYGWIDVFRCPCLHRNSWFHLLSHPRCGSFVPAFCFSINCVTSNRVSSTEHLQQDDSIAVLIHFGGDWQVVSPFRSHVTSRSSHS
ncbi:hypothetical protein BT93_F1663 [Corymbia citriodora subsp. variegata]|nr:hypothetical protein BT93_F1663 [Corymbia citriodora subsp. variegata]